MSFNILDHLDKLEVVKETNTEYHCFCPSCGDGGFKVNKHSGKYFAHKCGCMDTAGGKKAVISAIAPIPVDRKKKSLRPAQKRHWVYYSRDGKPLVRIWRIDYGDNSKPKRWQEHWDGYQWVKNLEGVKREDIPIYRYQEVREAIALGKTIMIAEGEPCCDSFWELGIAATTNIGGAGKWKPSDTKDLEGASKVVLCPDRDKPGVAHMEAVASSAAELSAALLRNAQWLYVFPDSPLWNHLPPNYGLDVYDWVENGATLDDISEAIGPKRDIKIKEPHNGKAINHPLAQPLDTSELNDELTKLLGENLNESDLDLKLNELATRANRQPSELRRIYWNKVKESEQLENQESLTDTLPALLDLSTQELDLYSVLPPPLAKVIYELAEEMPTAPEALMTALLPVWASGIGTSSRIVVKANSKYIQPAILRTAIVAKSGARKSPTLRVATEAIEDLERESRELFDVNMIQYQEELKAWEAAPKGEKPEKPQEPKLRRYLVKDINHDGLIKIHSENPNGLLNVVDELAGYFYRMNKFNQGKGDDEQRDLELFNGGSLIKDRMSESYYLSRSCVSVTGTIQWEVLQKIMQQKGENDPAGVLARWLVCAKEMPDPYLDLFSETNGDDLTNINRALYEFLRELPKQDYVLSDEAKQILQDWQHQLTDRLKQETLEPMAIAIPKFESYVFRLALVLHLVTSYFTGSVSLSISGDIAHRAVRLTNWFIGQYRYVLAKNAPQQSLEGEALEALLLLQKKGTLTPTILKRCRKGLFGKHKQADIKALFNTLIDCGYAERVPTKTGLKIKITPRTHQECTEENPVMVRDTETRMHLDTPRIHSFNPNQDKGCEVKNTPNDDFTLFEEDSPQPLNNFSDGEEVKKADRGSGAFLDSDPSQDSDSSGTSLVSSSAFLTPEASENEDFQEDTSGASLVSSSAFLTSEASEDEDSQEDTPGASLVLKSDEPEGVLPSASPQAADALNGVEVFPQYDFNELMAEIDDKMKRIGMTAAIGKKYLINTYGVKSRHQLSDEQLLDFHQFMLVQTDLIDILPH